MFINERLRVIERELGNVDEDISSYKSEHLLPDVQAASSMYMAQSNQTNALILTLNNQLYMTRYIRNYLTNDANRNQLLPANSGIESANIESQNTTNSCCSATVWSPTAARRTRWSWIWIRR